MKFEELTSFFSDYTLSDEDLSQLIDMIDNGEDQDSIDIFMDQYISSPSRKFQETISKYLSYADEESLDLKEQNKLIRNISILTVALSSLLILNFKNYVRYAYAEYIFKNAGLKDTDVKKYVLNEVLSEYEQLISGTMSQTQSFVINGIRSLQKEMAIENLMVKNGKITGSELTAEISRFKDSLRAKYPDIYNAIEKGNILVSRKFGSDGESVRHYKLDYYADMATRTTIMNVDRTATEIMAVVAGERAVEYYTVDPRIVTKDREICQEILHHRILGMSLLALDDRTASALGIMTLEDAKSTPDYAMGPNCRHGIRRLSSDILKEIDDIVLKAA